MTKSEKPGFVNTVNDASKRKVINNDKEVQTEPLKETKPKVRKREVSSDAD